VKPLLPYRLARQGGLAMAPGADGWSLWLRPDVDSDQLHELLRVYGAPQTVCHFDAGEFDTRLGQLYQAGENATAALIEGIGEQVDLDGLISEMPRVEDLLESDDEAPVIRLINGLFGEALRQQASDIHVETFEQSLVVRLRVDGHLREVLRPPRALSAMLVSRIKVMARLDIAEKRQPQDGRITLRSGGREVDVRVSTLPGIHGERVVMRVLDKQASLLSLGNLGMPGAVEAGHAGIVMGGTRVIYQEGKREAAISVSNADSHSPYLVQSWVENYAENNKSRVPFIVTPPLFRLDPEQQNVLRINFIGATLPADRESVFCLNLKSIAPKKKD